MSTYPKPPTQPYSSLLTVFMLFMQAECLGSLVLEPHLNVLKLEPATQQLKLMVLVSMSTVSTISLNVSLKMKVLQAQT